jgi:2-dehydropantoate 2-reductase
MAGSVKAVVYGLGAMGGFYTSVLNSARCEMTVVARSNYEPVKKNGLKLTSPIIGDRLCRSLQVVRTTEEASSLGRFDYVICTNKALEPELLPDTLKPVVTPGHTAIVLMQNGIGAEAPLQRAFSQNPIITCVSWINASQNQPGHITHNWYRVTDIGVFWNDNLSKKLQETCVNQFADLLREGGTDCNVLDDIYVKRWEKLIWNVSINSFTALTMLSTEEIFNHTNSEGVKLFRNLMTEMLNIAEATGVNLDQSLIDTQLNKMFAAQGGLRSSMMDDFKAARPMEVEVICGNALRLAQKHGVDVPILNTIYVLLKANDWRFRRDADLLVGHV